MCKKSKMLISLVLISVLTVSLCGCQDSATAETDHPVDGQILQNPFAVYKEISVDIKPSVKAYKAAVDLSNITNNDQVAFSSEAQNMLVKNGFVVIPSYTREFFSTYEANRYNQMPNFVTSDSMLHNYHLYFNYLLRTMEKDALYEELTILTDIMLEKSMKQYDSLKNTDWKNAAKRNVAFFSVAAKLFDSTVQVPSYVQKEVSAEYQLISEHKQASAVSPVINMGTEDFDSANSLNEDYTQYAPRGHYTKSNALTTYFKAMMWYGRMTLRAANESETMSAALITLTLGEKDTYTHWNNIYEPTNFFVGKSDDLGFNEYYAALVEAYGKLPDLNGLTETQKSWESFRNKIEEAESPAINSIPIYDETINHNREEKIKGFRFMGQRFTLDADIFQRLVYRDVGENSKGVRRMLPKGLDIPAAMGSQEAYTILKEMGETDYKNYPENMKKVQGTFASLDTTAKTQNLYGAWLYMLEPLTASKGEGYPSFMQNQAWTRKQLETYLGSWTELKHDTVLYAKQVYAEMGGGDEPRDDRGYVEPVPEVYGRLASLTRLTIDGLQSRKLIDESTVTSLTQLEELALKLKIISEKELKEQPLTDEEYDLIRSFGGQLEHFWLEALKDEGIDHPSAMVENPAALVSDVATDPNGQVLEEAIGSVNDIYVIVPIDGKLRVTKGAVYSYYEFPWSSSDRLTDEKWREMVNNEEVPASPPWTKTYTAPKGSSQW